jgi:hypothetical protein
MYKIIKHKMNDYLKIQNNDYIEIDVRDYKGIPCIGHDPIKIPHDAMPLLFFLDKLRNKNIKLIAVNIKSDGNEKDIIDMLDDSKIDYFVFDMSRPAFHRYKQYTKHIGLPISEYDTVEGLKHFNINIKYIWLDCFNGNIDKQFEQYLKIRKQYDENVTIIFVAPDLHNNRIDNIKLYNKLQHNMKNVFICTDYVEDFR